VVTSTLCLHRGARVVGREELDAVDAPAPTETWFPLRHSQVLDTVLATLSASAFQISNVQLSLSQDNARFFGTLDLTTAVASGTTLAVGVRNSVDKTFPLGFCAGCRVFVCDNLAFHSELLVARKHTLHGITRFQEAIGLAVQSLGQFREAEAHRIKEMRAFQVSDRDAESLMLRSYERNVISLRTLPHVIQAWRKPAYPEFEDRNLWSLMNAFTGVLKDRSRTNPQQFALQTIRLNALLNPLECSGPSLLAAAPPKGQTPCPSTNATNAGPVAAAT